MVNGSFLNMSGNGEILRAIEALDTKLNKRIDSIEAQNNDILSEFRSLKSEFVDLSKQHKKLSEEFIIVKRELNKLNQKSFDCDVIITGIPDNPKEILLDTVNVALKHLNIKLKPSDINSIFRMKNKNNKSDISPICLELFSRTVSGLIFHEQKLKGPALLNTLISLPANDLRKVFIKPRLSRFNQHLMNEARKFKAEHNFKFLWFQNKDILLKESESSRIFQIRSEEDLQRIRK